MKKSIFFTGLLFLALACSKDERNENNDPPAQLNTVTMRNSAFSPPSLQVNINVTVTWVNDDDMVHTVTANDGSFNSGDIPPGGTFKHTFTNTGTFTYYCIYHSGMTGSLIVTGIR